MPSATVTVPVRTRKPAVTGSDKPEIVAVAVGDPGGQAMVVVEETVGGDTIGVVSASGAGPAAAGLVTGGLVTVGLAIGGLAPVVPVI